jgi:hypothetical protein
MTPDSRCKRRSASAQARRPARKARILSKQDGNADNSINLVVTLLAMVSSVRSAEPI